MLGTMTRHMTVNHPAPRLRAASDRVLMSIAARPASSDRYAYGSTRTTYAKASARMESVTLMLIQT